MAVPHFFGLVLIASIHTKCLSYMGYLRSVYIRYLMIVTYSIKRTPAPPISHVGSCMQLSTRYLIISMVLWYSTIAAALEKSNIKDLPDLPYQPGLNFKFPACSFGLSKPVNRSFQSSWFQRCPWIHYDAALD